MPSALSSLPESSGGALDSGISPTMLTPSAGAGLALDIDPRGLAKLLGGMVLLLLLLHSIVQVLRFALFDGGNIGGLVPFFSLGTDGNLPTYYSSLALFLSGLILLALAAAEFKQRLSDGWYWLGLSLVFAFLAIDEMLQLHERLTEPVRDMLGTGGLLFYAWIIPYGFATLVLVVVYWRFLWRLPREISSLMVLAGVVFVGGAIGVEMLGGLAFERFGSVHPVYIALQTIEEVFEMAGVVLFIYATSSYLVRKHGSMSLLLGAARHWN